MRGRQFRTEDGSASRVRLARILLVAVLACLPALVAAAWLVPSHLDWSRYHGAIESIASATLGRRVTIEGPVSLSLLPEPALSADGVNVAGAAAAGGVGLQVRALQLRVALLPLLAGKLAPREIVLHHPELHLPWPLPPLFAAAGSAWLQTNFPTSFSARITDGELTIGPLGFSGIEATFTGSETGALSLVGTAAAGSAPGRTLSWHFAARLTSPGADGGQGLNVALDGAGRASGLGGSFAGQIAPDGTLDGRIAARGPDLSAVIPAPPLAFRGEGRLTVSPELAAADDLQMEVGGVPVQGTVALRLAPAERLELAFATSRLDLEPWRAALRGRLRPPVPLELDLAVGAGELAGGTIRHLRADMEVADDAVALRAFDALLPGDADFHLTGRCVGLASCPVPFEGQARITAPDLRPTLAWIGRLLGGPGGAELPPGVLRSASLAARVAAQAGEISLDALRGRLDGAPVEGTLRARLGDARSVDADLRFETLALDPWLAQRPSSLAALPGLLRGSLRIEAPRARWQDVAIDGLALEAVGQDGTLLVRSLAGASNGVRVTLAGSVGPGGQVSGGKLTLSAPDATPVAAALPRPWQATPALWREKLNLSATAEGPPQALAMAVEIELGDARVEAQPVLNLDRRAWRASVTVRHPGAPRLLAAAGLPVTGGWPGEGSLSMIAHVAGEPGRVGSEWFELAAGSLRATGKLALDEAETAPTLTGQVAAETLPLPALDGGAADLLWLQGVRGWRANVQVAADEVLVGDRPALGHAAATLGLEDARLRVDNLRAALSGGTLDGSARLDFGGNAPNLTLDAALMTPSVAGPMTGLPLDVAAGHAEGRIKLSAEGYSLAALAATASGQASLSVTDGTLDGLALADITRLVGAARASGPLGEQWAASAAAIDNAMRAGTTPFDSLNLAGTVGQGTIKLETGLLNAREGRVEFSGTVIWPGPALDLLATIRPAVPDPPAIGLRLSGPLAAPRRSAELAGLARWLADHPAQ